jgi:hypothetical protein
MAGNGTISRGSLCLKWEMLPKLDFGMVDGVLISPSQNCFALHEMAQNGDPSVVDHMQSCNDIIHWNWNFIRTVQDWELESVLSFLDIIYSRANCTFLPLTLGPLQFPLIYKTKQCPH